MFRPAGKFSFNRSCKRSISTAIYDVIVVGGGSAGLSFSKTASSLGARVALVDGVDPSPHGTTWGIGGTCANVGCIPKKLMHHASIIGQEVDEASQYGWKEVSGKGRHDWNILSRVVNDRVKANNWVYRVQLHEKNIKYYNAIASFVDKNTLLAVNQGKKKDEIILQAPNIVIATGLRPRYPAIDGAEYGVTSDDLFTLSTCPGKSLVVGAGYVALETAGFLRGFGCEVDLLVRSRPLKSFDKDCVSLVMENLSKRGVNIVTDCEVENVSMIKKTESGLVHEQQKTVRLTGNKEVQTYETIIWAMGRVPHHMTSLGVHNLGIATDPLSGRILVGSDDRTSINSIYALGDIAEGRPELTPTAIRSGYLLANRMFAKSKQLMNYETVPTTVFTPLELGTVGLTEEKAIEQHGEETIEVFHTYFTPFEFVIPQRQDSAQCYAKIVCLRSDPRIVLGMHIVSPNAAEIIQGYAVAMNKGITYEDIANTVAIHPCTSEEFVKMSVTKRSGLDAHPKGCCG